MWLEELDEVAGWVADQRLAAASPVDHPAYRFDACVGQRRQPSVERVDAYLDPVPSPGHRGLACNLLACAPFASDCIEVDGDAVERDLSEAWPGVHADLAAEASVEVDGSVDVMD